MEERVNVVSMSNGVVGIVVPELRFKRTWAKKGTVIPIEKTILKETMYQPGVEYLFKEGLLYIEDMEFKKEIGLEPVDAVAPVNVIRLEDKDMNAMMNLAAWEFEKKLESLTNEQKKAVAGYAIENGLFDNKKAEIFEKVCNIDILRAIQLKKANDAE